MIKLKRKLHPTHSSKILCKHYPLQYCRKCGLVYLKNLVTDKAMRQLCPDRDSD